MVNHREYQMNKRNQEGEIIMREELLKGLTEEQIKKVKACKNAEEILALAKVEGVTLSEEQLEAVSGGCGVKIKSPYDYVVDETLDQTNLYKIETHCYSCGSRNYTQTHETHMYNIEYTKVNFTCNDCGYTWSKDILQ